MFTAELLRHIREVRQNIRNFRFEFSPFGVYIPSMKATVQGVFKEWVGHPFSHIDMAAAGRWPNLVVTQGQNYLIDAGLLAGTPITSFYLGIGSGVGPVVAGWTGANYATNASEWTAEAPEGYSEVNRQAWTGVANTGNTSADNSASPATVTIVTAGTLNVNNAALIGGDNVKGGTTGTLIGAVIYGTTRTLGNGDSYNIQYEFDLNTP